MKLFIFILVLPCALGLEILCSDGYICPEGTHCCKSTDDTTNCCSNDNPTDLIAATKHQKAVVYSPAVDAHHFYKNGSDFPNNMTMYGYCTRDKDCASHGLMSCCSGHCCPFLVGSCCKSSCCRQGYWCCGDETIGTTEWCCPYEQSCSSYVHGLCTGDGVSLIPSLTVMIFVSIMGIGLFHTNLH